MASPDIVLQGGRAFVPIGAGGDFVDADIAITDGRISAIAARGQIKTDTPGGGETKLVNVDGQLIAPGFIDAHTHIFTHPEAMKIRLPADRIGIEQGVTCVVDAGSGGAAFIDAFEDTVHATQTTRAYAFVNIGSPGQPDTDGGHASRPDLCDLPGVVAALERHAWLVGVKVLASASHTGAFGIQAVQLAAKAAELTGKPLMLHIGNAPPVVDEVLDLLRPGDIITHTYHGKPGGVLTRGGQVLPAFRAAVDRGVHVDIGHGRSSFSFRVCAAALEQGMPIHAISSDLHRGNVDRYCVSLARTMTKMLSLGLSLEAVTAAVTSGPASMLGLTDFGAIRLGGPAHLTLFSVLDETRMVEDAEGEQRQVNRIINPTGCYIDGHFHATSAPL